MPRPRARSPGPLSHRPAPGALARYERVEQVRVRARQLEAERQAPDSAPLGGVARWRSLPRSSSNESWLQRYRGRSSSPARPPRPGGNNTDIMGPTLDACAPDTSDPVVQSATDASEIVSVLSRIPTPARALAARRQAGNGTPAGHLAIAPAVPTAVSSAGDSHSSDSIQKRASSWLRPFKGLFQTTRRADVSAGVVARRARAARPSRGPEYELGHQLYIAVEFGEHARAEALIGRGARTDHCAPGGWTPLLRATYRGDVAMVELLIRAGVPPDQSAPDYIGSGEASLPGGTTPLELCVAKSRSTLLTPLLGAKADPAAHDYAAVRRALAMSNESALAAFGLQQVAKLYNQDHQRIRNLEQELQERTASPARRPRGGAGLYGSFGCYTSASSREIARRKTLEGIVGDSLGFSAEDFSCVVCLEAPRAVLLQPCLHLVLCSQCAEKCVDCPICRRDVRVKTTVFLS
jgi:hypothetical protein